MISFDRVDVDKNMKRNICEMPVNNLVLSAEHISVLTNSYWFTTYGDFVGNSDNLQQLFSSYNVAGRHI